MHNLIQGKWGCSHASLVGRERDEVRIMMAGFDEQRSETSRKFKGVVPPFHA
jgi:hypothetical protein